MTREEWLEETLEALDETIEALPEVPLNGYMCLSLDIIQALFWLRMCTGEEWYRDFLPVVFGPEEAESMVLATVHNLAVERVYRLVTGTLDLREEPELESVNVESVEPLVGSVYSKYHIVMHECARVHRCVGHLVPPALRMWVEMVLADRWAGFHRLTPPLRERFDLGACFEQVRADLEGAVAPIPAPFWWARA